MAQRLRAGAMLAATLVIVATGCSGTHAARGPAASAHYTDPAGDGGGMADIRAVDVSSTKDGRITFRVRVDGFEPTTKTVVDLWLDTDANPETGNTSFEGADGADYLFSAFLGMKPPPDCSAIRTGNGCLVRFSTGGWQAAQARTATVLRSANGFTASIDRQDLGSTRELNFHVDRGGGAFPERAPGSGTFNYSLALGGPKPVASAQQNERADKAGARAQAGPTMLRLATHDPTDPFSDAFVAAVKHLAGDSIRIDVKNGWRYYDLAYEQGTIADVRHGAFDLAVIGARAWDLVGVKTFRPLVAPFLVDSIALEGRVLESPLADRMLEGVRPLGLVGLAVLPGELRRPLGVTRALIGPRDYRGKQIGIRLGRVAKETFHVLGATAKAFPSLPTGLSAFDGAEVGLTTIMSNRYDLRARALTSNVVLWPRATTIVMNRKTFDDLSSADQELLRKAGREAAVALVGSYQSNEHDSLEALCRASLLPLVAASAADRVALRRAVQPVYDELERDPLTRTMLSQIESIRARASSALRPLRCPTHTTGATHSTLEGVWRAELSDRDLRAAGAAPGYIERFHGRWKTELGDGRWVARNLDSGNLYEGTYTVAGTSLRLIVLSCSPLTNSCTPGSMSEYRWSVYRDKLRLSRIPGRFAEVALVAKPLTRSR